jgi:hypothetical protein
VLYTKHAIYGDGNGYYTYTQALYFGDGFNFEPILTHLANFTGRTETFSRLSWEPTVGPLGVMHNPYLIGPGILWLPSMVFISLVNIVFGLSAGRFDIIYELGPGVTGILFMISGLYFLEKYLRNFVSGKVASWVSVALYFGSYLLYYAAFEPALSHQPSFFIVSFLLFWTYKFKATKVNSFFLGFLVGLLAITRIIDVLLLIPIAWNILGRKPSFKDLLFGIPGFLIAVSPQAILQYFTYGTVFMHNYFFCDGCLFKLNPVHFVSYLFSPYRGLFVWSPIFILGVIGLVRKRLWVVLSVILVFWIITSSWSGYLSAGFGQRYSFSIAPYFALGIAYLFEKRSQAERLLYTIPFVLWNFTLLVAFYIFRLGR